MEWYLYAYSIGILTATIFKRLRHTSILRDLIVTCCLSSRVCYHSNFFLHKLLSRSFVAQYFIDIDIGITCHYGTFTIATAIHLSYAGKRFHIHRRTRLTFRCCIGSQVTAAIQLSDDNGFTTGLLDIHSDSANDGATNIITAKYTIEITIGDVECYIIQDISILSTTICRLQTWDTRHMQLCFSIHWSTLTATVCLIDIEVTTFLVIQQGNGRDTNITLRV